MQHFASSTDRGGETWIFPANRESIQHEPFLPSFPHHVELSQHDMAGKLPIIAGNLHEVLYGSFQCTSYVFVVEGKTLVQPTNRMLPKFTMVNQRNSYAGFYRGSTSWWPVVLELCLFQSGDVMGPSTMMSRS